MATAKKTSAHKTKPDVEDEAPKGTAITNWDEEFAKQAEESAKMEANTGGGKFFSLKSGVLSWDQSPLENNQMACIVVDSMLENVSYNGAPYDQDNASPPHCFAFSFTGEDMKPHADVFAAGQQINDICKGCPQNEFKSAIKSDGSQGKGKMCRNTRRLALIPAGRLDGNGKFTPDKEASKYAEADMGFMKLPVTSVAAYSAYVKQLAASLKRPPHGVYTKIKVVPDAKNQFKVIFEALGTVPNSIIPVAMSRHDEARMSISQPYNLGGDEPEATPAAKKTAAKKAAGKSLQAAAKKRKF